MPAVAPLDLLGSFQTKKQQKHLACFVRTSKNSFFNKKLFFTSFFDCCPLFLAHTLQTLSWMFWIKTDRLS